MTHRDIRVIEIIEDQRDARPGSFVDSEGDLKKAYGGERDSWMLIRPDGHLGFAASNEPAVDLISYVNTLFPARRSEPRALARAQSIPFLPGAQ